MAEMEFRIREIESDVKHHNRQISKISGELREIKSLINQIRWFISGGVVFLMADKMGFFAALGVLG